MDRHAEHSLELEPDALRRDRFLQYRRPGKLRVEALAAIAGDEDVRHLAFGELLRQRINVFAGQIEIEKGTVEVTSGFRHGLLQRAAWADDEHAVSDQKIAHHDADHRLVLDEQNALRRAAGEMNEVLMLLLRRPGRRL